MDENGEKTENDSIILMPNRSTSTREQCLKFKHIARHFQLQKWRKPNVQWTDLKKKKEPNDDEIVNRTVQMLLPLKRVHSWLCLVCDFGAFRMSRST